MLNQEQLAAIAAAMSILQQSMQSNTTNPTTATTNGTRTPGASIQNNNIDSNNITTNAVANHHLLTSNTNNINNSINHNLNHNSINNHHHHQSTNATAAVNPNPLRNRPISYSAIVAKSAAGQTNGSLSMLEQQQQQQQQQQHQQQHQQLQQQQSQQNSNSNNLLAFEPTLNYATDHSSISPAHQLFNQSLNSLRHHQLPPTTIQLLQQQQAQQQQEQNNHQNHHHHQHLQHLQHLQQQQQLQQHPLLLSPIQPPAPQLQQHLQQLHHNNHLISPINLNNNSSSLLKNNSNNSTAAAAAAAAASAQHGSATNLLGFMGLYVGNLSPDLTKEQLEKIFSKYGEPVKAHRLIRSPVAFIKYENTESPRAAIDDLYGKLLPELTLNQDQPLKLHFDRNDAQLKADYRPTELPKEDNGECYGWRTTVCRRGKSCPKKHITINRGIDFQMWMIKSTPTSTSY